jgi:hypothetical protein
MQEKGRAAEEARTESLRDYQVKITASPVQLTQEHRYKELWAHVQDPEPDPAYEARPHEQDDEYAR